MLKHLKYQNYVLVKIEHNQIILEGIDIHQFTLATSKNEIRLENWQQIFDGLILRTISNWIGYLQCHEADLK